MVNIWISLGTRKYIRIGSFAPNPAGSRINSRFLTGLSARFGMTNVIFETRRQCMAGDNATGKSGIGELWVNLRERGTIA
jgi:hypothetical protein